MQNRNKSHLERALHNFLKGYDISPETSIVNDFIFAMLKLHPLKNEYYYRTIGFDFADENDTSLKFQLPNLNGKELVEAWQKLEINPEAYHSQEPTLLKESVVFEKLLPQFIDHFHEVQKANPETIAEYQVQSKPKLEAAAIKTLKNSTKAVLELLLKDNTLSTHYEFTKTIESLILLDGNLKNLENHPILYRTISDPQQEFIDAKKTIEILLNFDMVNQNKSLQIELKRLQEAINVYETYTRAESVIACRNFMTKITEKLETEYKIAPKKCDIIEESLLQFAHATRGGRGECQFYPGSDASRLVFRLDDIDAENTKKVIKFLRDHGDKTAIEGRGYKTYSHGLPKSALAECAFMSIDNREEEERIETHHVETDGKFFFEEIYPRLLTHFEDLRIENPDLMKKYRDLSKKYLGLDKEVEEKIEASPTVTRQGIFAPVSMGPLDVSVLEEDCMEDIISLPEVSYRSLHS